MAARLRALERVALFFLTWLFVIGAMTLLARVNWRFEMLVHFRLHYAVAAALLLLLFLIRRRFVAAAFAATLAGANALSALSPLSGGAQAAVPPGSPDLRVVSLNVHWTNSDYADAFRWLQQSDADALVLIEATGAWLDAIPAALHARYPFQASTLGGRQRDGLAILSRYPIARSAVLLPGARGYRALLAQLAAPEGMVRLVGVHPPTPGWSVRERDRYLSVLARMVSQFSGPVVVAGDFNAVPWSYAYRSFLRDSGLPGGPRTGATWPAALGFAGVPIDHLLAGKGARVTAAEVGPDLGSDHRPIMADVSIGGPAPAAIR